MPVSRDAHFAPTEPTLTVDSARAAVLAWLEARQRQARFTVARAERPWKEELRWLEVPWEAEAENGELPEGIEALAAMEASPPSPWGQWSGKTRIEELRELGVLPEALVNFVVLTVWKPPAGAGEIFSRAELLEQYRWEASRAPGPLPFDFELLRRINHAWLERADLDRLLELALPYFRRVGWLPEGELPEPVRRWLGDVVLAVLPGLDFISLLPARTRLVFDYHPEHYLTVPQSREAMEREGSREVLRAFGQRLLEDSWLTVERFQAILDEVRRETHRTGRELHQPIRVALTGLPFGPKLEDLIPILEQGHELDLPVEVKSSRQRLLEFCSVFV